MGQEEEGALPAAYITSPTPRFNQEDSQTRSNPVFVRRKLWFLESMGRWSLDRERGGGEVTSPPNGYKRRKLWILWFESTHLERGREEAVDFSEFLGWGPSLWERETKTRGREGTR